MKQFINKKLLFMFLIVFIAVMLSGCSDSVEEMATYQTYHTMLMEDYIYMMEFVDEENIGKPYIVYQMPYGDTDRIVNLFYLNFDIYLYNLLHEEKLKITGEEMTELYDYPNAEQETEFSLYFDWYYGRSNTAAELTGHAICDAAHIAMTQAYMILYPQTYGESYFEEVYASQLTYEQYIEFCEWVLANPDYEFAKEYEEYYLFLDGMGLIPESERREVPEKEEELYDAEIYVVE